MRGRALRDFFKDLLAGDPVALAFAGLILLFIVAIGVIGFFIIRAKRRQERDREERRKRRGY